MSTWREMSQLEKGEWALKSLAQQGLLGWHHAVLLLRAHFRDLLHQTQSPCLTVTGSSSGFSISACLRNTFPRHTRQSMRSKVGIRSRLITPATKLWGEESGWELQAGRFKTEQESERKRGKIIHCTWDFVLWCQGGWLPLYHSWPRFWTQQRQAWETIQELSPDKSRNSSQRLRIKWLLTANHSLDSCSPHPHPRWNSGPWHVRQVFYHWSMSPAHGLRQDLTVWPRLVSNVWSSCFCLLRSGTIYTPTIFGAMYCSFEQQRGTQTHQGRSATYPSLKGVPLPISFGSKSDDDSSNRSGSAICWWCNSAWIHKSINI